MAQSGCSILYDPGSDWAVEMCTTDPNITTPMNVVLNGQARGPAALVRIYHQSQRDLGQPQVAVIYASGFIRLKQNADPTPAIPFGSSFILGPAYWPNATTYHHNPQLARLEIDTAWLPTGPLRMRAEGSNHDFDVLYELTLPPPRDRLTRLHVSQVLTATSAVTINAARRSEAQGFKLVQISSMFINESGACAGDYTDCHDSNAVRFIADDLERHQVAFTDLSPGSFIFGSPVPLGNTWLDALHTDDESWQGNTPNVRIALDALPGESTITPQGWITPSSDLNDDNVGLWLHDDNPDSQSWTAGERDQVSYWLLAQDDPPEPWGDLGLRSGFTFVDFEGAYNCSFVHDSSQSTSGTLTPIAGYTDTALQLTYNLGSGNSNWAQIRCDFNPPLDLSAFDHLRFDWRGDPQAANSIEVGLVNPGAGPERIFARGYHHVTHRAWWGQLIIPFSFLKPWSQGTTFDPSQVSAFFISIVKDPVADEGGSGRIAIDNLNAYNVRLRSVPAAFATVGGNSTASTAAAEWLAGRQQASGLLKSWYDEPACLAYTYDQALALIVFANEGMWSEAGAVVDALAAIQNNDGSWFQVHDCGQNPPVATSANKWEGDIAWAIYALRQYTDLGGTHPQAASVRDRAADWLTTRINPADGCLVIDHTEGTIDAWWALQAAGLAYSTQAQGLKQCLLTQYWDERMGRFKGGKNWQQPYLDNQTWGAAFLKAIGAEEKARRALSYVSQVFPAVAQGGQLYGLDGQAGPWSVWNEGTGQYIAVGGAGANHLLLELLAQQMESGAMPGSPDDFEGGGVWTTRWRGVAPTAWLYFALTQEPFHEGSFTIYLPFTLKK